MEHREFYKKLHKETAYGTGGHRKAHLIQARINGKGIHTLLDYGAGSCSLKPALLRFRPDLEITNYDPCVEGIDVRPTTKFDAVVSTDVLEHVPEGEVPEVVADIVSLTKIRGFHYICTAPASLLLPDGRNAHVTLQRADWWAKKFEEAGVKIFEAYDTGIPNNRDATWAVVVYDME